MTNETKERIKYYRQALPNMKEKVVAAALMLVIALSVTVTATYAWITLSTAPEVTSVDTTVASNGSLEIALANGTGSAPGKSAAGDSTGANNPVTSANITWGNLVNLSDPSYGLTKITLRPAALNGTSGLLTNPLYGVGYGEDGRVSSMVTDDDFAYVYYDSSVNGGSGAFLADLDGSHLGVRAISTVKYENVEGQEQTTQLLAGINQNLATAKNNYASMTNESQDPGKSYIKSLEGLIQVYAQSIIDKRFSGGGELSTLDITEYVPDLYNMMVYFKDSVMEPAGESYLQMVNLLDVLHDNGRHTGDAGYEDVEALVAAAKAGSLKPFEKENITSLSSFATDYTTLKSYLLTDENGGFTKLTDAQKKNSLACWAHYARNGGTVYWTDIQTHINWICDINTATLDGYTLNSLSSMSNALAVLRGSNPHDAIINGGAIYRMEQRIGQKMSPEISVAVDASAIMSILGKINMQAVLRTSVSDPYSMVTDRDKVKSFNTGSFKGDTATAEDTYAMAIDLWVRTNAGSAGGEGSSETIDSVDETTGDQISTTVTTSTEKAYLTLEGAVVMQETQTQATATDLDGNEQPVYTASYTVDGVSGTTEVFKRYGSYYYISTDADGKEIEVSFDEEIAAYGDKVTDLTYTPKVTTSSEIVGYEGVNRVWNEEQMAGFEGTGTSTTQGGGSCYVFYADTPADQSRFLDLLGSMRVVFVNAEGRQIGTASLDTANYYAETGKVTVPLVLDKTQAVNLGTDMDGNTIYGLMPLEKNAATRVTALVYLDGTKLTNDMVLASGDIQGTLNIQFGSSTALMRTTTTTTTTTDGEVTTDTVVDYVAGTESEAMKDEEVMNQFVELSASISPEGPVDYDPANPATPTLSVKVDGVEPNTVSARFIRKISSTQGVLQDAISLSGSGSDWTAACNFDKPGTYVLRSVWVDGVEYSLTTPVEFTVTGSSVTSLSCDAIKDGSGYATIMTADNSFSTKMVLGFNSSSAAPTSVNGIFMDEAGRQVNVPFTLDGDGSWIGTAKFTTSGTFTMNYVEIDGDIYELGENIQNPTLEILLGLKVRTWIGADAATLAKLQQVLPTALATNFVLDRSVTGDVTLNVTAEIYDNSGNELTGLSNVKLYYGRAGSASSVKGLDSNMVWNPTTGRYTGNFQVTTAGTFRFSQLTIGTSNTVESYTDAPSIQVMPPDDAYYYGNITEEYQYAPDLDGAMLLQVAYSDAVSKVDENGVESSGMEATITNGSTTVTVPGQLKITEDIAGKSVTTWAFTIPTSNGSQEGEWRLTDITMYSVYYEGKFYDAQTGVTVDLSDKDIHTKVANYLYVTLNTGADDARVFTGDFMADHIVDDITVNIADFEGNAIDTLDISDVKVVYTRDTASATLANYGYVTSSTIDGTVSGAGSLIDGSTTKYQIGTTADPVNFKYVGLYKSCTVSFFVDDTTDEVVGGSVTAGAANSGTKLNYTKNGTLSDTLPTYEVKWNAPDVKITAISPAQGTTFTITSSSDSTIKSDSSNIVMQDDVTNWISSDKYSAVVYLKYDNRNYREFFLPTVKMTLNNVGNNFSGVVLEVPKGAGTDTAQTYSFTSNGQEITQTIGYADGKTMGLSNISHSETGKQTITTVQMAGKDNSVWTAKLNHQIVINQQKVAPELTFAGLGDYPNATTPSAIKTSSSGVTLSKDGSNSMIVTLPSVTWSQEDQVANDIVKSNESTSNYGVCYYTSSWATYRYKYTYYKYNRTETTWTETSSVDTYTNTYRVSGWTINGKIYAPGDTVTVDGNVTATAVIEKVSSVYKATNTESRTATMILDTSAGTSTSVGWSASLPSGYSTDVESSSNIHTTAYTTYTKWQ